MLGRLERAIDRLVDGSLESVFRLRIQPAEIGRRLERAMLEGRATSVGRTIVPNAYTVQLHPDDAAPFADWNGALCRELEDWLAEIAYARGLATIGAMRVEVVADPSVRRRSLRVQASREAGRRNARTTNSDAGALWLVPRRRGGPELRVGPGGASIGRDEENDLVIPDPEVSRRHARIERGAGGWAAVDLDSTNGTWVNGERIARCAIGAGDEIAFGGVRYTVVSG